MCLLWIITVTRPSDRKGGSRTRRLVGVGTFLPGRRKKTVRPAVTATWQAIVLQANGKKKGGEMPWAEWQPHAEISQTSHQDGQINTAITKCQTLDCLPNQLSRTMRRYIYLHEWFKSMVNVGQNTSPIEHLG